MIINKALLKNGYSNFSLEILEYCEKEKAISRCPCPCPGAGGGGHGHAAITLIFDRSSENIISYILLDHLWASDILKKA
jgi:hypothetical protein